jgi:hypothetical protein
MNDPKSIRDYLVQRATVIIYNLELILDEIYDGQEPNEDMNKILDESCNELQKITERLNREYGQRT